MPPPYFTASSHMALPKNCRYQLLVDFLYTFILLFNDETDLSFPHKLIIISKER
jgi:hypothetical protein